MLSIWTGLENCHLVNGYIPSLQSMAHLHASILWIKRGLLQNCDGLYQASHHIIIDT